MLQSHIIEIDGVFVGAAVRIDRGYRFVAIDFRLEELNSTIWPTRRTCSASRAASISTAASPVPPHPNRPRPRIHVPGIDDLFR